MSDINDLDDFLQDLGILNVSTSVSTPSPSEEPVSVFSEEDVNNILENNGISVQSLSDVPVETPIPEEETSEGIPDNIPNEDTEVTLEEETSNNTENTEEEETSTETTSEETFLPINSPTLLINESTTRFSGAEWYNEIQKANIIIAGVGGIGSNLTFQLARMIPASIVIYDDDVVDITNMAGQLYKHKDINKAKVDAIATMVKEYTSLSRIYAISEKFTLTTQAGDIMMCGFDNMVARKTFFRAWCAHIKHKTPEEKAKCLFLDGRLSMDTLQVLAIQGNDEFNLNRYASEFLFQDSEAEPTVCSMKQTTYLACMIGSIMTNLFTNFMANQLQPIIPYDLPFFTEYQAQNMLFKTEY